MRIFSARPNPSATSYVPSPPFKNPVFYPHFEVIDRPDGVVVRARTRLPLRSLIALIAVSLFFVALIVAAMLFSSAPSLPMRLLSLAILALGLAGVWSPMIVPLYRAGPEPTLIELDRLTGRVHLPRAGLTLRASQVRRIERVQFEVAVKRGGALKHIHTVLVYMDDINRLAYVFLYHAEFRQFGKLMAKALGVPFLDVSLGVVGSYDDGERS